MKKLKKMIAMVMATLIVLVMSAFSVFAGVNGEFPNGDLDIDSSDYVYGYTEYSPYGVAEINRLTGIQLFACYDVNDFVPVDSSSGYSFCDAGYDFSDIVDDVIGAYSDHHYGAYGEYYGSFYSQIYF